MRVSQDGIDDTGPAGAERAVSRDAIARRAIIQSAKGSVRHIARLAGVNPKTVVKWRSRDDARDLRTVRPQPGSTVLRPEEESNIVRFRSSTALPLDDCYYALSRSLPHLSRSAMYRCLRRHGVARRKDLNVNRLLEGVSAEQRFGMIGCYAAAIRSADGDLVVISTVDHGSKFVLIQAYATLDDRTIAQHYEKLARFLPFAARALILHGSELISSAAIIERIMKPAEGVHCLQEFLDHDIDDDRPDQAKALLKYRGIDDVRRILAQFTELFNFSRKMKSLGGRAPALVVAESFGISPEALRARLTLEFGRS